MLDTDPPHLLKPVNLDAGYLHELRLPVHEGVVRACKHVTSL